MLFGVCGLLIVGRGSLFVVRRVLNAVCCLLFVGLCLPFVVVRGCLLIVGC